jgi:GNAT superfamily N-acetyltransferase
LIWEEAPIAKQQDRAAFDCGDADLDLYLHRFARQNHESGGAKCFAAVPIDAPARVLGFYTLSPASLEYARTPALAKGGLARYDVPVFRLGRLAVDRSVQGRGLGGALLLRAADRCIRVRARCRRSRPAHRRKERSLRRLVRNLWRAPSGRRAAVSYPPARRSRRRASACRGRIGTKADNPVMKASSRAASRRVADGRERPIG